MGIGANLRPRLADARHPTDSSVSGKIMDAGGHETPHCIAGDLRFGRVLTVGLGEMSLQLYGVGSSALVCKIVASWCGVDVELAPYTHGLTNVSPRFLEKNPLGKVRQDREPSRWRVDYGFLLICIHFGMNYI